MNNIQIHDRNMTTGEYERMKSGFDEHALEHGVAIQSADRLGFVAMEGNTFAGCASGLAYKNGRQYNGWFFLTDLFVEKAFRTRGLGTKLLQALEEKVAKLGVRYLWAWTAGYEAPAFYQKQGYEQFAELENWYSDGSSRLAFRKQLIP